MALLDDFAASVLERPGARVATWTAGGGPPVLLIHGFPQTHVMWHDLARRLVAAGRSVVLIDLRGYGRSRVLDGDHTFRAMADDAHAVMTSLGHRRFDVVGHDRGARVTHRLALDHPDSVASVTLLDILPTLDVWRLMDAWLARRYYHWSFLALPGGTPERMVGADPVAFLREAVGGLSGSLDLFHPEALADYEAAALRGGVVEGWCGDYRAGAEDDVRHDEADVGRTLAHPALVLWGSRGVVGAQTDPLACWRRWWPRARGWAVDAGHFLAEERPDEVAEAVLDHLSGGVTAGE